MNKNARFNEPKKIKFDDVDFTNHNFLLNIIDMLDLLNQVEECAPMIRYKNNQMVKKGNMLLEVSYTANNAECVLGSGFLPNTSVQNLTPIMYKIPLNDGCYDYLNSSEILKLYRDFKESQLDEDYISEDGDDLREIDMDEVCFDETYAIVSTLLMVLPEHKPLNKETEYKPLNKENYSLNQLIKIDNRIYRLIGSLDDSEWELNPLKFALFNIETDETSWFTSDEILKILKLNS